MDKSNYISICKRYDKVDCYQLTSTNKFLHNRVKVKVDDFTIILTVADLSDKCYTPSVIDKYSRMLRFHTDYEIPLGRYEIADDSTEDELIIDWNYL